MKVNHHHSLHRVTRLRPVAHRRPNGNEAVHETALNRGQISQGGARDHVVDHADPIVGHEVDPILIPVDHTVAIHARKSRDDEAILHAIVVDLGVKVLCRESMREVHPERITSNFQESIY